MANLNLLLKNLDGIYRATGGNDKEPDQEGKEKDAFTQLRKEIAEDLKGVRRAIASRTKMMGAGQDSRTAKASHEIRSSIKDIRMKQGMLIDEFNALEKAKQQGKSQIPDSEMAARREVLELISKHIKDVEEKDKAAFTSQRDDLFDSMMPVPVTRLQRATGADVELRDLGDDFTGRMAQLDAQEEEINQELDVISGTLMYLKEIAVGMGSEIERQEATIQELDDTAGKEITRLRQMNRTLKDIIKKTNCGAQRFIIWAVLIVILLAMAGIMYKVIADNQARSTS